MFSTKAVAWSFSVKILFLKSFKSAMSFSRFHETTWYPQVNLKMFFVPIFAFACNAKTFAIVFLFLHLLLLLVSVFGWTGKRFSCTTLLLLLLVSLANIGLRDYHIIMCAFMPYVSEMNKNDGVLSKYVESCSLTTKNIKPPLPQSLWPPNFADWWFTMRGSRP